MVAAERPDEPLAQLVNDLHALLDGHCALLGQRQFDGARVGCFHRTGYEPVALQRAHQLGHVHRVESGDIGELPDRAFDAFIRRATGVPS